jgi:hypothetical protein
MATPITWPVTTWVPDDAPVKITITPFGLQARIQMEPLTHLQKLGWLHYQESLPRVSFSAALLDSNAIWKENTAKARERLAHGRSALDGSHEKATLARRQNFL